MILSGLFAGFLFLLFLIGDWYQFTNLRPFSARYGFGIAHRTDYLKDISIPTLLNHFDQQSTLQLPHGVARWFVQQQVISLRPYYQLFTMRFRTAWPLKGTIELSSNDNGVALQLTKRMPWSSSVLTMLWLVLVVGGAVAFLVMFGLDGGFGSAAGLLMGFGLTGLGILILLFGLLMISLAYRLEDSRLMQVYEELQVVLAQKGKTPSPM